MPALFLRGGLILTALVLAMPLAGGADDKGGWIDLSSDKEMAAWTAPSDGWGFAGGAELDAKNPRQLAAKDGTGVLVNTTGKAQNLTSKQKHADLEAHVEFLIGKGSNSGVKMLGLYEIQITDSHSKKPELTGNDCGGIYPRAEEKPKYHHIDKGVPPRTNAAKPAGEWQTLDIVFRAPCFDAAGKKTANAKFVKVVLNGEVVHENVEVEYPTGAAWRLRKEVDSGPFFLQADHGPVAFRNVRIRPLTGAAPREKRE